MGGVLTPISTPLNTPLDTRITCMYINTGTVCLKRVATIEDSARTRKRSHRDKSFDRLPDRVLRATSFFISNRAKKKLAENDPATYIMRKLIPFWNVKIYVKRWIGLGKAVGGWRGYVKSTRRTKKLNFFEGIELQVVNR
jgi:hypothetical protein